MAVFRLNLVTEEEIIKCLGEDRVAIVSGSRTAYEELQCQIHGSKHQAQPETQLETCSCPCPTGGMYNQPTSRINDSRIEIPFLFPEISKTPEKKNALFPTGSSEASLSGIERYDNELDSEWLSEYSGSESSTDYMEEARKLRDKEKLYAFLANIPVEPQSWRMKQKLGPLFGLMTCLGINPYTTFIRKNMYNYKIEPFSPRYISFFLVLLLTSAITGISWANFLRMFSSVPEGLPFSRYTEYLELEKYWPYAVFHLLSFGAVTARGAIIYLRNGKRHVEFMNRWHLAVIGAKYDPYEDIAGKIQLNIAFAGIYSLFIIILYCCGFTVVQDACGLFGILLCRSFTPAIRTGGHFELVRLAGLFMHIYITFAERMIITYMLVYCKLLDNFTRNWNLRMAYTLGMLGQFEEREYTAIRFVTKIPFSKLYAEHLIITTFAKLTGKIFNVNFILFFLVKFADISILAYRVITFMTVPGELNSERFEEEFLDGVYVDREDRVRFQDPVHYQFLCVLVIFFITLLGWFLTTLDIIEPGRTIQSTFGFVRRWGFMQCTSCAMKRFIMSLNFKLSNPGGYYFSPGFIIDRRFITYSAVWTIFFILQILAFNPYKVTSIPVDICSRDPATGKETCVKFHPHPDYDSGIENKIGYRIEPPIKPIIDLGVSKTPYIPPIHVISAKPTTRTTTMTTTTMPTTTPAPKCDSTNRNLCHGNGIKRAVLAFKSNQPVSAKHEVRIVCCYSECSYVQQDVCINQDEKGILSNTLFPDICSGNYSQEHLFYISWAASDVFNRPNQPGPLYLNFNEIKNAAKKPSNINLCQDEVKYKDQPDFQKDNYKTAYNNFFTKNVQHVSKADIGKLNIFGFYDVTDVDKLEQEWMQFSNCVCQPY